MVDKPATQTRRPGTITTGGRPGSKEELRRKFARSSPQEKAKQEEQKRQEEADRKPTLREKIEEEREQPKQLRREEILKSLFERQQKQKVTATKTKEGVLVTFGKKQILAGREGEVITSGREATLRSGFLRRRLPPKETRSQFGAVSKGVEVKEPTTPEERKLSQARAIGTLNLNKPLVQAGLEVKNILLLPPRGVAQLTRVHPMIERRLPPSERIKDKTKLLFDPGVQAVGGMAALAVAPPMLASGAILGMGALETGRAIADPTPRKVARAAVFGGGAAFVTGTGLRLSFKEFQFESLTLIRGKGKFSSKKAAKLPIIEPETGAVLPGRQTQLFPKRVDVLEGTLRPQAEPPRKFGAMEILELPLSEFQIKLGGKIPRRRFEILSEPSRETQLRFKRTGELRRGVEVITPAKRTVTKAKETFGEGDIRVTALERFFKSKRGQVGFTTETTMEVPSTRFETTTRIRSPIRSRVDFESKTRIRTTPKSIISPVSLPKSTIGQESKARSKLGIIPLSIQVPKSIVDIRPIEDVSQRVSPKSKTDLRLDQIVGATTKQDTRGLTSFSFTPPSASILGRGGRPSPPKPIEEDIIPRLDFGFGFTQTKQKKKKKKKKGSRQIVSVFNPSLTASALKIFGKAPKPLTGIGIRPIPLGRKRLRL